MSSIQPSSRSRKGFHLDEPTTVGGKLTTLRELDDVGRIKTHRSLITEGHPLNRQMVWVYEAVLNNAQRSWVITPEAYQELTKPLEITYYDEIVEADSFIGMGRGTGEHVATVVG